MLDKKRITISMPFLQGRMDVFVTINPKRSNVRKALQIKQVMQGEDFLASQIGGLVFRHI